MVQRAKFTIRSIKNFFKNAKRSTLRPDYLTYADFEDRVTTEHTFRWLEQTGNFQKSVVIFYGKFLSQMKNKCHFV